MPLLICVGGAPSLNNDCFFFHCAAPCRLCRNNVSMELARVRCVMSDSRLPINVINGPPKEGVWGTHSARRNLTQLVYIATES